MRLLKKKIERVSRRMYQAEQVKSTQVKELHLRSESFVSKSVFSQPEERKNESKKTEPVGRSSREKLAMKNIIKNYGRAIANFSASKIAFPYLEKFLKERDVNWEGFIDYALTMRDFIQNIETFRDSMLKNDYEGKQKADYKEVFRISAEIFMKYFSVNWIFSGKMLYKMEYLKLRGNLLRRIKNPGSFTRLKSLKRFKNHL
jgi:hypothetical protein